MMKETDTKETIGFFITFLSLVAFELGGGGGSGPHLGYTYETQRYLYFMLTKHHILSYLLIFPFYRLFFQLVILSKKAYLSCSRMAVRYGTVRWYGTVRLNFS